MEGSKSGRGGARNFPKEADFFDEGTEIWLSGYYRYRNPRENSC